MSPVDSNASADQTIEKADKAARERRGTVLVFNSELLPASQTFIRDHVESIQSFDAMLLGVRRVPGLDIGHLKTATLPSSPVGRLILWLFGRSTFLDRLVRDRNVVVIHAHFADAGMRIARYVRRRRLPLIVTLHGADVLRERDQGPLSRIMHAYLMREMLRSVSLFLAVSKYIEAAALRSGYPQHRLHRHELGIPLVDDVPPPTRRAQGIPEILFVGRMVEKKGLTYLLQACDRLADESLRFTLTIIGDGPLAALHRKEAESLGDRVRFLGTLPPPQVREALNSADIFCMPSTKASDGDNEGLPIVCLEAQAAGLPVVAFAQGPVPEGVEDSTTAILARDKSVDELADALKRLILDRELRERMGSAGRRFVRERFDIRDRSRELDQLYKAAVKGAL